MPGPSNLYGVANAVQIPYTVSASSDTVCTAGQWNVVASSAPITASTSGWFYAHVFANFTIVVGASPLTGFQVGSSVNNGAVVGSASWDYRLFTANVQIILSCDLPTSASNTVWAPPGATVQIQVYPYGQNCTARQIGTFYTMFLLRAPDL